VHAQIPIQLTALEDIAYAPIPRRKDPLARAAKNKLKKLKQTRKYQSKFWGAEKQDQICAERAAKRLKANSLL